MKRLLYSLSILIALSGISHPSSAQEYFHKRALCADLDTLRAIIDEVHPNMFAVMSQAAFESELNKIKESLSDSMSKFEFFLRAAPLVSSLRDGHTQLYLPYKELRVIDPPLFPYEIEIDNAGPSIRVKTDLTDGEKLPKGTRITKINGMSDRYIIETLLACISGESTEYRTARLCDEFADFLYLLAPSDPFTIEYQTDGCPNIKSVPGCRNNERKKRMREYNAANTAQNKFYSFSIDKQNDIAVFDFRQFDETNNYYRQFLDSMFTEIKAQNIGNLIIDLRNNGGGNSGVGDEIFQYISPVPFAQFGTTVTKMSTPLKKFFSSFPRFKEMASLLDSRPNGVSTGTGAITELRENPLRYGGNVYLLTSSLTFSSAAGFAGAFQYFNMGKIVGEETGGWIVCFGDTASFSLPNTKLWYGVSWKEFYRYGATDQHRHGVIPDIAVPAEQAMETVLRIINDL